MPSWFDAHCHWQDERLAEAWPEIRARLLFLEVCGAIVNGTSPADWSAVAQRVAEYPGARAAYGVHPWWVGELPDDWQQTLLGYWDCGGLIGEIGLDLWKNRENLPQQKEVFLWQWRKAVQRNSPASVHCLRAWPELRRVIQLESAPACGFLLHAYGGPSEDIPFWVEAGAFFSFSSGFLGRNKLAKAQAFRWVPPERLLLESDAPAMAPPPEFSLQELPRTAEAERLNHPVNLVAAGLALADLLEWPVDRVAEVTTANALRLFAPG